MIMIDFLRVRKSEADTSKIRKILVKNFVFNSKKDYLCNPICEKYKKVR